MKNIPIIIYISLSFANYEIGDIISISHQQIAHEICYGEYENDVYTIGDANFILNGGLKQITIMKLSASW